MRLVSDLDIKTVDSTILTIPSWKLIKDITVSIILGGEMEVQLRGELMCVCSYGHIHSL